MEPAARDPQARLRSFIDKFEPGHQRLIRDVRDALRRRFPTAHELVYDNYNFFVIGYCPTERPSDAIISMAAGSNGVGLCFIRGAGLPDPKGILEGSGRQTRFIRLESAATLARPEVEALLAEAVRRSAKPLPQTGRGRLIIRSVSEKQRPRRRTAGRDASPRERGGPQGSKSRSGSVKIGAKAKTIDEYLASVDRGQKGALQKLRQTIRAAVPRAEECISYGIPAFRLNGKFLVGFGAGRNHCAFYPGTVIQGYGKELEPFETSKGTIRFQPDHPLPVSLVRKLVKGRVARVAPAKKPPTRRTVSRRS
jgi:uncharacterized protein YdhG (YjbR/CyaY superfamily)